MENTEHAELIYDKEKVKDAITLLQDIETDLTEVDKKLYSGVMKTYHATGFDYVLQEDKLIDMSMPEKLMDQSYEDEKDILKRIDYLKDIIEANEYEPEDLKAMFESIVLGGLLSTTEADEDGLIQVLYGQLSDEDEEKFKKLYEELKSTQPEPTPTEEPQQPEPTPPAEPTPPQPEPQPEPQPQQQPQRQEPAQPQQPEPTPPAEPTPPQPTASPTPSIPTPIITPTPTKPIRPISPPTPTPTQPGSGSTQKSGGNAGLYVAGAGLAAAAGAGTYVVTKRLKKDDEDDYQDDSEEQIPEEPNYEEQDFVEPEF